MTKEQLINKSNEIYGNNKYDFSLVPNSFNVKDKINIICHEKHIYGEEHGRFETSYDNFINKKHGCKFCSKKLMTTDVFIKMSKFIHKNKYDYSKTKYIDKKTKVCIICPKHGEFWQLPYNHLKYGCEDCGNEKTSIQLSNSLEKFKEDVYNTHKYEYDYSTYVNYKTPMKIFHKKCGNWFYQTPSKHIYSQHGCPFCKLSKGQQQIYQICLKYNLNPILEYSREEFKNKKGKQKIDIFLEKQNLAIEFQGIQHFKNIENFYFNKLNKQILLDKRKKEICDKLKINILYVVDDINNVNWNIDIYNINNVITINNFEKYIKNMENKTKYSEEDIKNINLIKKFLEEDEITFRQETITIDFPNTWQVLEEVFYLNDDNLELRYANSWMHKVDNEKRFGEIQRGIPKDFFGKLSEEYHNNGKRIIWIKDYEISDCSDIITTENEFIKDYHRKWEVMKSYIRTACGKVKHRIYARDCEVREIPSQESTKFLQESCFYGKRGANVTLGLYLKKDRAGFKKGKLLFLMSFGMNFYGNKNFKEEPKVEVIRVGTTCNTQLIGGSSKLLKYFMVNYPTLKVKRKDGVCDVKVGKVIFYVDACHNNGNSMAALGYKFVGWDTVGFHNYAVEEINIPELKVAKGKMFQRKPAIHGKIMDLMGKGIIVSIATAGTIVYEMEREEYLATHS